jgi:hypothetical protein
MGYTVFSFKPESFKVMRQTLKSHIEDDTVPMNGYVFLRKQALNKLDELGNAIACKKDENQARILELQYANIISQIYQVIGK